MQIDLSMIRMESNTIIQGDALSKLKALPKESINMCMTSPPYWALRDYGVEGQLGLEPTFDLYIKHLCDIFDEVKRVLRKDGTCWVNLGDTYYGSGGTAGQKDGTKDCGADTKIVGKVSQNKLRKTRLDCKQTDVKFSTRKRFCCNCGKEFNAMPGQYFCGGPCAGVDNTPRYLKGELQSKCLTMIPMRFAIEMVNRGWILRNVIIWHKPNCMPSSVKDRFTVDFEYIFFFSKNKKYYFETQYEPAVDKESYTGRKRRRVNTMAKHDIKNYQSAGRIQEDGWLKGEGKKYPNRNKRTVWDIKDEDFPIEFKNRWSELKELYKENDGSYIDLLPIQDFYFNLIQEILTRERIKETTWRICPKPFSEAHFAVYPEELCETPIKAGCPEFVCKKCGNPEVLEIENKTDASERRKIAKQKLDEDIKNNEVKLIAPQERPNNPVSPYEDLLREYCQREGISTGEKINKGYKPTCDCKSGFTSGIVLDPFFGSGTTGLVALKQGKKFIGIELNPEYIEIANKRLKPFLEQSSIYD